MPDFSHVIPDSHRNVSPGFLEMLIRTERKELFTGLMRLSHESGEDLLFSFLEGIQQKLYRCADGAVETLPRQTWQDALGRGCARVGLLRLRVEAMRFMQVIHEAPVRSLEELTISPEQLVETVRGWGAAGEPGIVHVQGENINWYDLMAGASTPVVEELSVANGEVRFSLSDTSLPKRLPNQDCHVNRQYLDSLESIVRFCFMEYDKNSTKAVPISIKAEGRKATLVKPGLWVNQFYVT